MHIVFFVKDVHVVMHVMDFVDQDNFDFIRERWLHIEHVKQCCGSGSGRNRSFWVTQIRMR